MQEIPIHGVRFLGRGLHGNIPLLAVLNHLCSTGEIRPESLIPPRSDDFNLRRKSRRGQFESNLIIPFARGSVSNGLGFFFSGNLHHPLGDQGSCDRGAQEILALVNCPSPHHREDKIPGKLLLQVVDIDFGGSGLLCLGVQPPQFLFLTDVGAESDHLRLVVFLEPGEQHGGVETSGICQNDFHDERGSNRIRTESGGGGLGFAGRSLDLGKVRKKFFFGRLDAHTIPLPQGLRLTVLDKLVRPTDPDHRGGNPKI